MTVQGLINELTKIEDKTKIVMIRDSSGSFMELWDIEINEYDKYIRISD